MSIRESIPSHASVNIFSQDRCENVMCMWKQRASIGVDWTSLREQHEGRQERSKSIGISTSCILMFVSSTCIWYFLLLSGHVLF